MKEDDGKTEELLQDGVVPILKRSQPMTAYIEGHGTVPVTFVAYDFLDTAEKLKPHVGKLLRSGEDQDCKPVCDQAATDPAQVV